MFWCQFRQKRVVFTDVPSGTKSCISCISCPIILRGINQSINQSLTHHHRLNMYTCFAGFIRPPDIGLQILLVDYTFLRTARKTYKLYHISLYQIIHQNPLRRTTFTTTCIISFSGSIVYPRNHEGTSAKPPFRVNFVRERWCREGSAS